MKKIPRLVKVIVPALILAIGMAFLYPVLESDYDLDVFFVLLSVTVFCTGIISMALSLVSLLFIVFTHLRNAFLYSGLILLGLSVVIFNISEML